MHETLEQAMGMMPFKKLKQKGKKKFKKVIGEFYKGKLKRSSGKKVMDKKMALAVAFSVARKKK